MSKFVCILGHNEYFSIFFLGLLWRHGPKAESLFALYFVGVAFYVTSNPAPAKGISVD